MAKKLINTSVTLNVIGGLLFIMGTLMLTTLCFAYYYQEPILPLLFSSLITIGIGTVLKLTTISSKNAEIRKRDGYLIVTMGWLSMAIFGTLPYLMTGAIPSVTNAFF